MTTMKEKQIYNIFIEKELEETVRVPSYHFVDYKNYIMNILKKYEKKCNKFGYIDRILKINDISQGIVYESDFSSDLIFKVKYLANASFPKIDDIIKCNVFQVSNSDIIAKNGPLLIIVMLNKNERKKLKLNENDTILVKIVATRLIHCMPIIKVVAVFKERIIINNSEQQFIDDFDFIEQE